MAEAVDQLETAFIDACEYVKRNTSKFREDQLLQFYGLYKQAVNGACSKPKPMWYKLTEIKKWQAWSNMKDIDKRTSMEEYVKLLSTLDINWQKNNLKKSQHNWVYHSTLKNGLDDDDDALNDSEKTIFDHVKENNLAKVESWFEEGHTNFDILDSYGIALMHWAADRGHVAVVDFILSKNAKVDIRDNTGQTPLHYAAACGHLEVVKCLLMHGADSQLKDDYGEMPFNVADSNEIKELLTKFVK